MEQMNLIPPEVMAEISDGNSTKLPDNTRKMLQILASLNTPKELLASLLEIAEFSLHHVRYLAGPLVIHRSPWSDTIPQWLKFACIQDRLELIFTEYEQDQEGWGKRHVTAKPNLDSTQSTPTPKPSSNSTVQISLF